MSHPSADPRQEAYRSHARRCITLASKADHPAVAEAYREVAASYQLLAQWATGPSRTLVLAQLGEFWDSLGIPEAIVSQPKSEGIDASC